MLCEDATALRRCIGIFAQDPKAFRRFSEWGRHNCTSYAQVDRSFPSAGEESPMDSTHRYAFKRRGPRL